MRYNEYTRYDPMADAEMVRISCFNPHGHEYWSDIPTEPVRRYRKLLAVVLEELETAIQMKAPPGQIEIDLHA